MVGFSVTMSAHRMISVVARGCTMKSPVPQLYERRRCKGAGQQKKGRRTAGSQHNAASLPNRSDAMGRSRSSQPDMAFISSTAVQYCIHPPTFVSKWKAVRLAPPPAGPNREKVLVPVLSLCRRAGQGSRVWMTSITIAVATAAAAAAGYSSAGARMAAKYRSTMPVS